MSGGKPAGRSRRRWGWHPLRSEWAARVVDGSGVVAGDLVLDLGAGDGALTAPLVAAGARVLAVELHPGRAARLRERFTDDDVTVVERDLRDLRLPARPFRVVASPPFTMTTAIVRLLARSDRLRGADLVLQRGAARRLVDDRALGRRRRLELGMPVPRRAFRPPPQVDCVVLRVT